MRPPRTIQDDSILILGTAGQGPVNTPYQVTDRAVAAQQFGFAGTLERSIEECATYSDNIQAFRIGTTPMQLTGVGLDTTVGTATPGFDITFSDATADAATRYQIWYKAGVLSVWKDGTLEYSIPLRPFRPPQHKSPTRAGRAQPIRTDGATGESLGKKLFASRVELIAEIDKIAARDALGDADEGEKSLRADVAELLRTEVAGMATFSAQLLRWRWGSTLAVSLACCWPTSLRPSQLPAAGRTCRSPHRWFDSGGAFCSCGRLRAGSFSGLRRDVQP